MSVFVNPVRTCRKMVRRAVKTTGRASAQLPSPSLLVRYAASLLIAGATLSCNRTPASANAAEDQKASDPPPKEVMDSTIPGRWYSSDPVTLGTQMRRLLDQAPAQVQPDLIALILPHAGFQFSGATAAAGVKAITKPCKRVVVLGPSHNVRLPNQLSVPRATHAATPLGEIRLDTVFIERMLQEPFIQENVQANTSEHSTQMVLPLLQTALTSFKLVPIVVGHCSEETILRSATLLKELIDDETLVVVSSDFTHYGPNYGYLPFHDKVAERIKQLDNGAFKLIEALDMPGFLGYCRQTGATICGRMPIAILLAMLEPDTRVVQTAYDTSGRMTGDYVNSVSYLSAALTGSWRGTPTKPNTAMLSNREQQQLITLARKALAFYLEAGRMPDAKELGVSPDRVLEEPRGVFVTLKQKGRLRGCIGEIFPRQPLYRAVIANAINAGVNDRRFRPVTKAEYETLTFEISVLTTPTPVAGPEEVRVGRDGVVLSKADRSSVFLPQVASEQKWNREQMLTQLARKAGLPPDAWKAGASLFIFQAEVFGEAKKE